MSSHFATVALPLHYKYDTGGLEGLTYSIPEEFVKSTQVGTRVKVPLGKRQVTGIIVEITSKSPEIKHIRPITDLLDTEPVFDKAFLDWTQWIASYYLTSWGEILEAALPQGLKPETKSKVFISSEDISAEVIH